MDKDLKGNVIEQRKKDSHSVEVDGTGRFCGHRFLLKTKLYGEKRCTYCGRWFQWEDTQMFEFIRTSNIDDMNPRGGGIEPLHCGSEHCQEYHRRYLQAVAKRRKENTEKYNEKMFETFKALKKQGVIE